MSCDLHSTSLAPLPLRIYVARKSSKCSVKGVSTRPKQIQALCMLSPRHHSRVSTPVKTPHNFLHRYRIAYYSWCANVSREVQEGNCGECTSQSHVVSGIRRKKRMTARDGCQKPSGYLPNASKAWESYVLILAGQVFRSVASEQTLILRRRRTRRSPRACSNSHLLALILHNSNHGHHLISREIQSF